MTKILIAACFIFSFISCNTDNKSTAAGDDSMAQKNLAASRKITEAFGSGDISGIDSVVASDFVDHTDRGDMGRDSLKAMIKLVHATNKDMKTETIREVADDEYVFSLMRFTGVSDGTMMPAGPYDMHAIQVARFKDGKAVEHWEYMQPGEMMKMMEKMQGAGMSKPDSTKK